MKTRIWKCPCCGFNTNRKKNETVQITSWGEPTRKYICTDCDVELTSGIKIPKYKNCKHQRKIKKDHIKKQKMKDKSIKYYSVIRNNNGNPLRVSSNTRKLFKHVIEAKRRPTLIKRSQKFLDSLYHDIDRDSVGWTKEFDFKNIEIKKSGGGWVGAPKISLEKDHFNRLGVFKSGIMYGGMKIHLTENQDIKRMIPTLIHETTHWIDSMSRTPSNHDCYFKGRVRELGKKLKYKNWKELEQ